MSRIALEFFEPGLRMRQCLPITRPPAVRSSVVDHVSKHMLLTVADSADEDGAFLTVSGKALPADAVARSPVLQELVDVPGSTSLPFTEAAFWSWVDQVLGDLKSTKVATFCTNIEVAAFLQDDAMVAENAQHIAYTFRAALRADIADSGAISAPHRPVDDELAPFLAAAYAAQASIVFPRLSPAITLTPGPQLAEYLSTTPLHTLSLPVLEAITAHLHLYEILPAPLPVRTAALAVALRTGHLDLMRLNHLNPNSSPDPVPLLSILRTLQPSLPACPPITSLRLPADALFDRPTCSALIPHLPQLQHLTICSGFASVDHPAVLSFLNRLPSQSLQTLDFCDCQHLPLSAHVWQSTRIYGLDMPPPLRWLRTQMNRIRPPRAPKLHPKLAHLRSLNLHIHSQDPAMVDALPMPQLTRLRIAFCDCPLLLRPSHPAVLAASSGAPSLCTVAIEASTLAVLAAVLRAAAVLQDLHLDVSLATLSSVDAARELHTLAASISERHTLTNLGFLLRDSNHTQRPALFTQLSQLTALQRLTCSKTSLVAPQCLRALPALTAVEFLRPDGAPHPEAAARALVEMEDLSRLDRLVLPGPLSTQEFRSGGGDELRPLRDIRVVGALEGYRRLTGTCLAAHQYGCHCWDPSGYDAICERVPPDPCPVAEPGMHVVSAAMLGGDRGSVQEEEDEAAVRVPGMESVRVLKLYVREGGSMDGALNCLMGLDRLERVEVTGIEMWPWVGGFLGALRSVAPLTNVVLHGCEGYATRLLEELEQLPRLQTLERLDLMITVVDRGFLGVPREAEVSGRTHSARRGNSAKLARLREKCEAVEERWRALVAQVANRVADAAVALPGLETVRVHLECPAMESVAHKLLR